MNILKFNFKVDIMEVKNFKTHWDNAYKNSNIEDLGWNENGGGLWPNANETSNDVAGGIGMVHRNGSRYSAGDYIGCCQNVSGFNRTARVEMYIR